LATRQLSHFGRGVERGWQAVGIDAVARIHPHPSPLPQAGEGAISLVNFLSLRERAGVRALRRVVEHFA
jgi:hypothetical protein